MMLFTFTDGLGFSLLSITLVILLIGLIILAISPLKRLSPQKPKIYEEAEEILPTNNITDEDMMVAALVASIDYREETGNEPYLKSIREIEQ